MLACVVAGFASVVLDEVGRRPHLTDVDGV